MTPTTETTDSARYRVAPGLISTLRGFLYATAAASLAGAIAAFNESKLVAGFFGGDRGSLPRLADAEEVAEAVLAVFSLAALVTGILAVIWWYQAYRVVEASGTTGRKWSSGWAVGGWFIPFANLIIPKLVLNEVERVLTATEEGATEWRHRRISATTNWWWALFVIGAVVFAAGLGMSDGQLDGDFAFDADLYLLGVRTTALGMAVSTAAALVGAAAMKPLGRLVSR